jgi:ABC-type sugar transport system permease subunit
MSASWTQKRDRFGGLGVYTIIYLVFIYGPVLVLPIFSFNDSIYIGFPLKGFTLQWYEDMINNPRMLEALMNSLKVGGTVAVLSTILGTLAAKAVTGYRMPGRGPVVGFIMLPLVIPEIIMGLALLVMVNTGGIDLSLLTIGIGHMLLCVPFSMVVMISRLEGFDKKLEEAALDLGENPLDLLAGDLPACYAGFDRQPAADLHDLIRRVHPVLLPGRHGRDPTTLHLEPVALSGKAAGRVGAGSHDPDRDLLHGHLCRMVQTAR